MNVDSNTKPGGFRAAGLGILGLPIGVVLWFLAGYLTAFLVGGWKETELKLVQAAFVLVEIGVIVALVLGSIRMRQGRAFLVGILISFTTVTLLFWTSWVP